jgi:hypothetical protein
MKKSLLIALAINLLSIVGASAALAQYAGMPSQSIGYTSPTHKARAGEIVFSETEVLLQEEKPEAFSNQFTASSSICGRIYLHKPLAEVPVRAQGQEVPGLTSYGQFSVLAQAEGSDPVVISEATVHADGALSWTTFQLNLNPVGCPKNADEHDGWAKFVRRLEPGTHTIKLSVFGRAGMYYTAPIATT